MAPTILNCSDSSGVDQRDIDIDIPAFDLSHIQSEVLAGEGFHEAYEGSLLRSEFRRCCEEWGCFRVTNHGIPDSLIGSVEILFRDVFKLPKETKEKNGGYGGSTAPFHESLTMGLEIEAIQEFSDLMWPHGNQNFCQVMREYFERQKQLSDRIHKIILATLGVRNYYDSHFEHGQFLFRMNAYQVSCDEASGSLAFPAHTDLSSITILHEDEVGGLQVLSKAGNWVDVKPMPNSFIVFAGDMLQVWSNKRIHSIKHRVLVKGRQSRLSLAFFRFLPFELEIDAPPELVDNEHPRCYKAFLARDYTAFLHTFYKAAKRSEHENPLDTYAAYYPPSANEEDTHGESS